MSESGRSGSVSVRVSLHVCFVRVSSCRFSGLPGAYPAVVRALGRGDERRVQQGAAFAVPAPGRRRLQGPPRRRLQGRYHISYIIHLSIVMMHLVGAIVYYIATSTVLLLDYTLVLSTVSVVVLLLPCFRTILSPLNITSHCTAVLFSCAKIVSVLFR